jgi:hypothetical protein
MRPSFGPLTRPRARIHPPPRRGFAAAPRLPAPSFRFHLALARLAPADARLRFSGAGLPVPRRLETFRSLRLRRGVWRRSSTSAITSVPIRGHNRRIVRSPPTRYLMYRCRCSAGRPDSSSSEGRSPRRSLAPVTGLLPSNQGPVASLSLCTSGVAALRALSRVRRRNSVATPTSMFARTSRRRARGE